MKSHVADSKARLRRDVRERVRALDAHWRASASEAIRGHALQWVLSRRARRVLAFLSLGDEPALGELLDRLRSLGIDVCLPRVDWGRGEIETVSAGASGFETLVVRHGVREPSGGERVGVGSIDAMVVPGVAFDATGRRLGRGGGHYDRLLASARSAWGPAGAGRVLGVCWGVQLVAEVPSEAHDARVDAIASEGGLVRCRGVGP